MKLNYLFFVLLTSFALSFSLVSCNDDDDDHVKRNTGFELPELTADNAITITYTTSSPRYMQFHLQGGKVAVDWGDGNRPEKDMAPDEERSLFIRRFNSGTYKVKIWSEHLTYLTLFECEDISFPVCPELAEIHLYNSATGLGMKIEHFDGAKFPKLSSLGIALIEQLKILDVSKCPELKELNCSLSENLTELDLSKNKQLNRVRLEQTGISSLKLGENENLEYLELQNNSNLEGISLERTPNIRTLTVVENENITSLDLSVLEDLTFLNVSKSGFTSLQIDKNSHLSYLVCNGNKIRELDLTKSGELAEVICCNNELENISLKDNTILTAIYMHDNNLSAEALNSVFTELPKPYYLKATAPTPVAIISYSGNPGSETCNPAIATEKGWKIASTN